MIVTISRDYLANIRNPDLAAYAAKYIDIYEDYLKQITGFGLEIDNQDFEPEISSIVQRLKEKGARFRNMRKSLYINKISPACLACRMGVGSQFKLINGIFN